jgi:hypothetical protein
MSKCIHRPLSTANRSSQCRNGSPVTNIGILNVYAITSRKPINHDVPKDESINPSSLHPQRLFPIIKTRKFQMIDSRSLSPPYSTLGRLCVQYYPFAVGIIDPQMSSATGWNVKLSSCDTRDVLRLNPARKVLNARSNQLSAFIKLTR